MISQAGTGTASAHPVCELTIAAKLLVIHAVNRIGGKEEIQPAVLADGKAMLYGAGFISSGEV